MLEIKMKKRVIFLSLFVIFSCAFAADGGRAEKIDLTKCKTWEELVVASRLDLPGGLYCAYTVEELLAGVQAMPDTTDVDRARKRFILAQIASEELVCPESRCLQNYTQSMILVAVESSEDIEYPDNICKKAERSQHFRKSLDDPLLLELERERRVEEDRMQSARVKRRLGWTEKEIKSWWLKQPLRK
jgi:hypothetical protein